MVDLMLNLMVFFGKSFFLSFFLSGIFRKFTPHTRAMGSYETYLITCETLIPGGRGKGGKGNLLPIGRWVV